MSRELARKVADAVLYEGYMLYPYRRSAIKNQQRWSFGILYPPAYEEVQSGTERSVMHSECLVQLKNGGKLEAEVRFLQLAQIGEDREEGIERSIEFSMPLPNDWHTVPFTFPANSKIVPLRNDSGRTIGTVKHTHQDLSGTVTVLSEPMSGGVIKLTIEVINQSRCASTSLDRNSALQRSLLSAHTILSVRGGKFISLLDPPAHLRDAVSQCKNVGNFPVLVGEDDEPDMMLCSPIVLYDYPQIAPESAGDFYDATEMDEMLTLRVMTQTDDEKSEIRNSDDRVRDLLQRTEGTAREQLMRTHGTIRGLRPSTPSQKESA
jgi:hydrogenase maturation protease